MPTERSNTDPDSPAVVEVGGVTTTKQSGNPRPRVFRIVSQQGMINSYVLNSVERSDAWSCSTAVEGP